MARLKKHIDFDPDTWEGYVAWQRSMYGAYREVLSKENIDKEAEADLRQKVNEAASAKHQYARRSKRSRQKMRPRR